MKIISSSSKGFANKVIKAMAMSSLMAVNSANAETNDANVYNEPGRINISQLEDYSILKKVSEYHKDRIIQKFKTPKENTEEIYNRMSLMLNFYSEVESSNNSKAVNNNPDPTKRTTAQGSYQVVKGSIVPAMNRLFKSGVDKLDYPELYKFKLEVEEDNKVDGEKYRDFKELTHEVQSAIILSDLLQKKGTDKKTKKILLSKQKSQIKGGIFDLYKEDHHTKTDEATDNRLESLYPKYEEEIGKITRLVKRSKNSNKL